MPANPPDRPADGPYGDLPDVDAAHNTRVALANVATSFKRADHLLERLEWVQWAREQKGMNQAYVSDVRAIIAADLADALSDALVAFENPPVVERLRGLLDAR